MSDRYTRPGWKLLRLITTETPGTFDADPDWAGADLGDLTNDDCAPIPRQRSSGGAQTQQVSICVEAYDADGLALPREAATAFTVQAIEQFARPNDTGDADGARMTTIDSEEITTGNLNRRIVVRLAGETQRFAVRFSDYADMPATAVTLAVFYRDE